MTATETPAPPRSAGWTAAGALFALTVRQHTHGRRLYVVGLLYLLPCALALVLRNLSRPAPADALEFALVFSLLPHALAPLTALLYAAGVISDEVEEQTITYLLMRSVPRWALYLVKLAATLCVTTMLVTVGVAALYLAIYAGSPEFADALPRMGKMIGIMALAQVGYCALFGFLGLFTRRSLAAGVGYIILVEGFLANMDFVGRTATVAFQVRTMALRVMDWPQELMRRYQQSWGMTDLAELPTASACATTLLVFGVVVTVLTAVWFARTEFRVKTPGSD